MLAVYNKNKNITIAVALSGGVDSAVAAGLLKKQGYKVVGFFMKNWSDKFGLKDSDCPWHQDRQDAMAVAAKLDIPFHTLDFEKEYKEQVLSYFFKEYKAGRTPNPDVFCNSQIKFGVFLDKALELGADYIATGHYARVSHVIPSEATRSGAKSRDLMDNRRDPSPYAEASGDKSTPNPVYHPKPWRRVAQDDVVFRLLKSKDQNKDQTYFLYRLNQSQLSKTIFSIGDYTKPEIRKLAKKFGLPNHSKPDSQGVCFVGHLDLRKFLSQKIKDKLGEIVTVDGKVVGKHRGLFWYTIGQRKGIEIGGIGPFYVVEKNLKKNQLIVTNNRRDERLYSSEIVFNDVNWIGPPLGLPLSKGGEGMLCQGRIRYREPLVKCRVEKMPARGSIQRMVQSAFGGDSIASLQNDKMTYRATFAKPVWAAAPGQSVVFYDKDICLGGGIIR